MPKKSVTVTAEFEESTHEHGFTYASDGAAITATCANTDGNCTLAENKVALTISAEGATYDGNTHGATLDSTAWTAAGLTVPTIQYGGRGNTTYNGETAPTNAGDYTAGVTVDTNKTASVNFTISKADSAAAAPTGLTAIYGQTLADVVLTNPTGNTPGTWAWVDDTTDVGTVGEHKFKANFMPTDTANYNAKNNVDVTVTVGKAANPATVTTTATVTKGGNTVDLSGNVTLNDATGDVSYAISGNANGCTLSGSVLTSGNNAGNVTVNVTVAEDGNYNALAATPITVTISDKGIQTITAENVTANYGDTDKSISATTDGNGTISYAVKEGSGDYIDINTTTGALTIKKVPTDGKAYITVTAAETSAYAQATKELTITINKANVVAATVTANNRTYDSTEKALVTVAGEAIGGTMQYALGTATEATQPYTTSVPTGTNAGTYHVWYMIKGDENHNDSNADHIEVVITKFVNSVTVSIEGWTYGDTAKTPTATAEFGAEKASFTYSDSKTGTYSSTVPENAGTYYVKASIAGSDNYESAESEAVSFTIAPKALTDEMLTLDKASFEHDGTEQVPVITVKDGATVLVKDTDYTIDSTSTTNTSAYGDYTIKVNGKGNYTGSASKGWEITDNKAPEIEITIQEDSIKTAFNAITFGWFFNETETFTITATDAGSGVDKIYYFTSGTAVSSVDDLIALAGENWTEGKSFSKDPNAKFIVYAKVTDKKGNTGYAASNGVVLDNTKPVVQIDGANAQTEYHKAVSWTAEDEYLDSVVITFTAEGETAGTEIVNKSATAGETQLAGESSLSELGSYTITTKDKAGNKTEVTFAITGRAAEITGKNESTDFVAGKTYDLKQLFTVEDGVNISSFAIVANADESTPAGDGTIEGAQLTIKKAGLITIQATVAKGQTVPAASETAVEYIKETTAAGTLSVGKAEGSAGIIIADTVYGNGITPVISSSTNAAASSKITYTMTADADGKEISKVNQKESETKPVQVGTYKAVVAYEATGLYKEVSAECTFKITPAALTVTAEAKEKTYGSADPALTYTVAGLAYEDKAADVLTGALARAEGENAGLYAIGQGTLKANSSYTISYTGANLTIGKAAVGNKTATETVEVSSAGVKDKTIDLKDYLVAGAALAQKEAADGKPAGTKVETAGALAGLITPGTLKDGVFTYSVAENDGGLTGQMILTISSLNYADYTITINLASAKKVTEVVVESEGVTESAVETVEVPALEDYTEAQPEATVEVKMEVKLESEAKVEEKIGTTTLNKIEESVNKAFGGVNSSELKKEYLDVTVTKSVNGGEAQEIADVNRVLEIAVGYDLTGKYNPIVVREHGGAVSQFTRLSGKPAAGSYKDGTFYVEGSGTTGKIYIYARYFSTYTVAYTTAASYQVTFDDALGNTEQVVVETGNKATKPANPKRSGYDFDGWFIGGTNTKWNFDTAVTSDLVLKAKWSEQDEDDDEKDGEIVVTPVATTAQPRSPKTNDGLPGYGFWMLLLAAGIAVSAGSVFGRKKNGSEKQK